MKDFYVNRLCSIDWNGLLNHQKENKEDTNSARKPKIEKTHNRILPGIIEVRLPSIFLLRICFLLFNMTKYELSISNDSILYILI